MTTRLLAFALLAGSSLASAAPPEPASPTAPQEAPPTIDVDAMARAKDGSDAAPSPADAEAPVPSEPPAAAADAPTPAAQGDAVPNAEDRSIAASCESRAASLLDDAQKADFANATRDFDAKMRTAMPAQKLKEAWESLAQFGKLEARGQSHLGRGDGYTIVMIPLIFEKANLVAQVACGTDGRIAGFYIKPAPMAAPNS